MYFLPGLALTSLLHEIALVFRSFRFLIYRSFFILYFCFSILGGVKTKARYASPLPLKIRHIPRIGYVSLFPFLLNILPVGSNRLKSMLDIIESPDLLWSNHGLRSIAKVLYNTQVLLRHHVHIYLYHYLCHHNII